METLREIHTTLQPHYSTIALVLTWIGLLLAWWRRRSQWHNKEFLGQVNFTLNLFDGSLQMRTVKETETKAVWPNAYGVSLLHAASRRTTTANPFIRLLSKPDRDYIYRAIKNAISPLSAEAFVAGALKAPVHRGTFLFALTCERYPEIRTVKLRVLLIEEATLREWCVPGGKANALPMTPFIRTRLQTLQAMYEMDRKAQAGGEDELGRVELGVV